MIPFFHGFGIGLHLFPLFYIPIFLLGYLIRDKIQRRTTKWIWLILELLALICCDVAWFLLDGWNRYFVCFTAWGVITMLLGHGICVLIQTIRRALNNREEESL